MGILLILVHIKWQKIITAIARFHMVLALTLFYTLLRKLPQSTLEEELPHFSLRSNMGVGSPQV